MKRIILSFSLLLMFVFNAAAPKGAVMDINTILMRSTFKIVGSGSLGTAFIIGKPVPNKKEEAFYVLVTAAHVLRDINGEQATLFLRKKQGDDFIKFPHAIQIRDDKQELWKEHPNADVAVMYVNLPNEADVFLVPISLLATDNLLEKYEIHPGDVLSCLGYPLGAEANDEGFPILRRGQIASYPLTPTKKVQTFLFDFRVFAGNSGGPVYFTESNRQYGDVARLGETIQFFAGLVSKERLVEEEIQSLTETRRAKHSLSLAVVVHASLILETIGLLPPQPSE